MVDVKGVSVKEIRGTIRSCKFEELEVGQSAHSGEAAGLNVTVFRQGGGGLPFAG